MLNDPGNPCTWVTFLQVFFASSAWLPSEMVYGQDVDSIEQQHHYSQPQMKICTLCLIVDTSSSHSKTSGTPRPVPWNDRSESVHSFSFSWIPEKRITITSLTQMFLMLAICTTKIVNTPKGTFLFSLWRNIVYHQWYSCIITLLAIACWIRANAAASISKATLSFCVRFLGHVHELVTKVVGGG